MQIISSISSIIDEYDAYIIDLWGVIHDGTQAYSGALEAVKHLKAKGKKIIFLSNAPRQASKAKITLDRLGITKNLYDKIITSGQAAHNQLSECEANGEPFSQSEALLGGGEYSSTNLKQTKKTKYYYLGPSKDEDVIADLKNYSKTNNPEEAAFILNAGFEYDFQPEAEIMPTLERLIQNNLELICINPDMEVVKQDGTKLLCAGWVGGKYAELGGKVKYFGKPHARVYELCFEYFGGDKRILAIGDNLDTDIKGANKMEIDSLLISGGILKRRIDNGEVLEEIIKDSGSIPTYISSLFCV